MNRDKWQRVTASLRRNAGRSDRQVAKGLSVSPTFVGRVRRSLEMGGKLVRPEKRVGKDRKTRRLPFRKPKIDTANLPPEVLALLNGLVALGATTDFGGEGQKPSGEDWRRVRGWVWARAARGEIDLGAMAPEEKERLRQLAQQYRDELAAMEFRSGG